MKFIKVKIAFFFLILQVIAAGYTDDDYSDSDDYSDYYSDGAKKSDGNRRKSQQSDDYDDFTKNDDDGDLGDEQQGGACNRCGMANGLDQQDGRIINGREVRPTHKYPWIVALVNNGKVNCGGSLISATAILTAGHCVFNKRTLRDGRCSGRRVQKQCYLKPNMIKVRLAGARQQDISGDLAVRQIIGHPMYSFTMQINDIAIIHLQKPVRCSKLASPVCLAPKDGLRLGTPLITAGYGFNTPDGITGEQVLREGTVQVIKPQRCAAKPIEQSPNFLKGIVCAAGMKTGQSSCFGDSGSSVIRKSGNLFYSVGVVSKGKSPRCSPQNPVTYTKTFANLRFIQQNVRDLPRSGQSL